MIDLKLINECEKELQKDFEILEETEEIEETEETEETEEE